MSQKEELKSRVEAKKKQLEADLAKFKADTQGKMNERAKEVETKLQELNNTIKDGWNNLGENAAEKINQWLKD